MNKQDVCFCPYEPCGVYLRPEEVAPIVTNVNGELMTAYFIGCSFCQGQYIVSEHRAPMSLEDLKKKWMDIPLTDKKAIFAAKRNKKK